MPAPAAHRSLRTATAGSPLQAHRHPQPPRSAGLERAWDTVHGGSARDVAIRAPASRALHPAVGSAEFPPLLVSVPALVAQGIERRTPKPGVAGSNPAGGTDSTSDIAGLQHFDGNASATSATDGWYDLSSSSSSARPASPPPSPPSRNCCRSRPAARPAAVGNSMGSDNRDPTRCCTEFGRRRRRAGLPARSRDRKHRQ